MQFGSMVLQWASFSQTWSAYTGSRVSKSSILCPM